jgi:primary-amine oxidase
MLDTAKTSPHLATAARHPLDPLTAEEITAACGVVRRALASPDNGRFPMVRL